MNKASKVFLFVAWICVLAVCLEAGLQCLIKNSTGQWYYKVQAAPKFFMNHPWLIGVPIPGLQWKRIKVFTICHNSLGFRGPEIQREKQSGQIRVMCYGGSTTYGVSASDDQTWPYKLGQALGPHYQVINAGVPGYSTAENIIQTALQQFDYSPDVAIYYEGWNDIREMHVNPLKQDYSDLQGGTQPATLHVNMLAVGRRSATIYFIRGFLHWIFMEESDFPVSGKIGLTMDPRALAIYRYNLKTIVALCKSRNIRVVFVHCHIFGLGLL